MERKENEFETIDEAIVYAESNFLNFEIKKKGDVYVVVGDSHSERG